MAIADDITDEVQSVLDQAWNERDGYVVPTVESVALKGGAVNLRATMLYADLADSTSLAIWNRKVAAKVFKCFLSACSRLIRHRGGEIRSFDGDRVMGVFVGTEKNTDAARCALNINWAVSQVLLPKFKAHYQAFQDGSRTIKHCVGIDTSDVLVVRAGVPIHNDLVWVGRSPNIAAKLCTLREDPYNSWITADVFDDMANSVRQSSGTDMWEQRNWAALAIADKTVYRSKYYWAP